MMMTIANVSESDLGLMTMAPLALIVLAALVARRWWRRQPQGD